MKISHFSVISALALAPSFIYAADTEKNILSGLPTITTTACKTDSGVTATWTATQTGIARDVLIALAGKWHEQPGAEWKFSTDTKNVQFYNVKPVHQPSMPKANSDAIKLDSSNQAWTLTIPLKPDYDQLDVNAGYSWQVKYADTKRAVRARSPPSAKHHRLGRDSVSPAPATPTFDLKITGLFPCKNGEGLIDKQPPVLPTATIDPAVASQCAGNHVPIASDTWDRYNVRQVLHDVFKNPPPKYVKDHPRPTKNGIDIGAALMDFVGNSGKFCQIANYCPFPDCADTHPNRPADNTTVPLYLATRAYVGFSNWLTAIYKGIDKAAISSNFHVDNLAGEFFTDPPTTLDAGKLSGAIGPFLGIASGIVGMIPGGGVASGAIGAFSGVVGAVGGIFNTQQQAAHDPTYLAASQIKEYLGRYYDNTQTALTTAHTNLISDTNSLKWFGEGDIHPDRHGLMSNGAFLDPPDTQSTEKANKISTDIYNSFSDMFLWKTINYAYNASNVFIIYVPYGKIIDGWGNTIDLSPSNCDAVCAEALKCFCDKDPKQGMARLFRAEAGNSNSLRNGDLSPKGLTSNRKLGSWTYNNQDIILGSLNSWRTGDFKYDIENFVNLNSLEYDKTFQDILENGLRPTIPGIFNLPVCKITDLNSFPLEGKRQDWTQNAKLCLEDSAGGGKDANKKFRDFVSEDIKKAAAEWVNPGAKL